MNWAKIICKHHNEWVSIVKSFGEYNYCEDIVQEMYIRLHNSNAGNKCITNNEPNRSYIWITLKNIYITYAKQKTKYNKVSLEEIRNLSYEEDDIEKKYAFDKIKINVKKEIDTWHHYDQQLWNIYSKGEQSMRDISSGAEISLSSIFNSIKNCKTRIKEAVGEDYEDYINKDYDKI